MRHPVSSIRHLALYPLGTIIICSALLLTGCANSATRNADSTFLPDESGQTWQYVVKDQGQRNTEADRQAWIRHYLHLNHLCPNGYTITNRQEIVTYDTWFGPLKEIHYHGRCTG